MQQSVSLFVTLEDAKELFLTAMLAEGFSETTLRNYRCILGLFERFLKQRGVHTLQQVTPEAVRQWLVFKRENGVSPHHILNCYRLPRRWWRWLMAEGLVQDDAFANVRKPRTPQIIKSALDEAQVAALLRAASEGKGWLALRNRALVMMLLSSGLRATEAHRLKVRDVLQSSGNIIVYGKGGKMRIVPLLPEVKLAIQRYLIANPFKPQQDDPLWWGINGALTLGALKHAVYDLAKRAGIRAGPHALRRTFATRLLQDGVSMEHVRQLLGHSGYAVIKQYVALTQVDLMEAAVQHNPLRSYRQRKPDL
ncbi:MAG: tyrosine recombinase XerC [Armatimonadota bacterium]|nr:MAG: tyrosine recombinase XerC [Armatimonadota bacterium]